MSISIDKIIINVSYIPGVSHICSVLNNSFTLTYQMRKYWIKLESKELKEYLPGNIEYRIIVSQGFKHKGNFTLIDRSPANDSLLIRVITDVIERTLKLH